MAKSGEAGRALGAAIMSSLFGALFGAAGPRPWPFPSSAPSCSTFGSPEFFMLSAARITFVASLSGEALLQGLIAGGLGLWLATIGLAPHDRHPAVYVRPALPLGRDRPGAGDHRLLRDPRARSTWPSSARASPRSTWARSAACGRACATPSATGSWCSAAAPSARSSRSSRGWARRPPSGWPTPTRCRAHRIAARFGRGAVEGVLGPGRRQQLDARRKPRHHRRLRRAGQRQHGHPHGRVLHPGSCPRAVDARARAQRVTWP